MGDGEPIQWLRPEEQDAFRVLFEAEYGFVRRTLRHFGIHEDALDDAAQDVFVIVHRRWADYDGRSIRSWLWGMARRVAGTYRRTHARRGRRLELASPSSAMPAADEATERRQAVAFIDAFLDRLDPHKRAVFQLSEVEGLSAPEIADILGVKLNTVYSRLRVARQRFSRDLERHHARERGDHA
jgi:RNA polymerase sigma-70 factor (ECF subfamily)